MSERLDIRLTEEEKKRLAELAGQKGISMTDLVRIWITKGDVVHVLSEQFQDITNDFAKWHVLANTTTNICQLCQSLQGRMADMQNESRRVITFEWIGFFVQSFQLMRTDVLGLKNKLRKFISQKEPKGKDILVELITEFTQILTSFYGIFVQGFMNILQNMSERTKKDIGARYNDEFRTRYNEIMSKYEDFLKRTQRELGVELEQVMPRAKEFRAKE